MTTAIRGRLGGSGWRFEPGGKSWFLARRESAATLMHAYGHRVDAERFIVTPSPE